MKYKHEIKFFRDYDILGLDEYLNDMYQQGWLFEEKNLVFFRFKKIEDHDGFIHYNNIKAEYDNELTDKCLEHGFVEIDKHIYKGNSYLDLCEIQKWRLERYANKTFWGLGFWVLSLVYILTTYFNAIKESIVEFDLFILFSGQFKIEILYLLALGGYSFILHFQEYFYKLRLRNNIRYNVAFTPIDNQGVNLIIDIGAALLFVFIYGLSLFVYFPLLYMFIGLGILILLFGIFYLAYYTFNKSIFLKIFEFILLFCATFCLGGVFNDFIGPEYNYVCTGEWCSIENNTIENVFYDIAAIGVDSDICLDYFEATSDFSMDLTINHYVEEYDLSENSNIGLSADKVYTDSLGNYLIVKGNKVIFVSYIQEDTSIEDINKIL